MNWRNPKQGILGALPYFMRWRLRGLSILAVTWLVTPSQGAEPRSSFEADRARSLIVYSGLRTFPAEGIIGLKGEGAYKVRSWLSLHLAGVAPIGTEPSMTFEEATRQNPFLLMSGMAFHANPMRLGSRTELDFFQNNFVGLGINRTRLAAFGQQPFLEVGGGLQLLHAGRVGVRAQGAVHFAEIPLINGTVFTRHSLVLELGAGYYF